MSASRQQRRAAERQQTKQARQAANQANAQLSTGPKTPEGKAKSSLNAVKTGLTGRTVLLPTEDAALYAAHVRNFLNELRPIGAREQALAQSLADTAWRLDRIPALEMAIYAQGHIEFAGAFDEHDPALRPGLIELHTYLAYEKQLRNLHLQEMRLRRQREKDTAEFRQLQQDRVDDELEASIPLAPSAQFGFDFSTIVIESLPVPFPASNPPPVTPETEHEALGSEAIAA